MGKIIVRKMLKTAFAEFGAEMMKNTDGVFVVKYNSIEYFLDLNYDDETFSIIQVVMGSKGKLSQREFKIMMSVVKEFHPECNGSWNDGYSYIESKWHSIMDEHGEYNSARLENIFKDFFKTWTFACANASLASQQ